jgi:hypothetical protein
MVTRSERNLLQRASAALGESGTILAAYDRASDTLMLHFRGQPRPAVSIPIESREDGVYVRLDRETNQVVGLQIEGFIADFIDRFPELADLLKHAHLRGIDRDEAVAIARRAQEHGVRTTVAHFLRAIAAD